MNLWQSAARLRQYQREQLRMYYSYVFDEWKWYDYRRIKLNLYNFISSFIAHFLIKWKVKPNYITAVYAIMGVAGGILVAIPDKAAIYCAISFFYFKGLLDWCDGAAARVNNQVTLSGAAFDGYAASVGWIALWGGVGIYLGNSTDNLFYYLAPVIPVLFAADIYSNLRDTLIFRNYLKDSIANKQDINYNREVRFSPGRLRKIKNAIDFIFQHEVHSVDFICLLILIETLSSVRILWVYYSAFLVWQIIIFFVRLVMITRGGLAESELRKLREYLYE